jgi:hypothetical protein
VCALVTEMKNVQALVLATINAPYSKKLTAQEVAYYLEHPAEASAAPGPMSSFFGEVAPDLQELFAGGCGISHDQLAAAAKAFSNYSGQSYPLAA